MVPPDSIGISRVPTYSGASVAQYSHFGYGTLTLFGPPFQARSPMLSLTVPEVPQPRRGASPHGLGSSAFARRYSRNLTFDFFSSGYLDVSVPRVGFLSDDGASPPPGFPIRTSPDLSLLAAPRGFSQLATSFIAGSYLGIHPVHFPA
jgi:hypothetical protein